MAIRALLSILFVFAACAAASAQSSFGVRVSGEFANRTVRTSLEGTDPREDALTERTSFAFRPGVALAYERQFTRLIAFNVQARYQTLGYKFDAGTPPLDPETGGASDTEFATRNLRYDFIGLGVGAVETWGSGPIRFYAEEYLVPMLYLRTNVETTFDGMRDVTETRKLERVNDFHLGVQAGVGIEHMISDILRVRVGLVGRYHFTLTNEDTDIRDHLYSFGPQVSFARVFGKALPPTGKADEIYY